MPAVLTSENVASVYPISHGVITNVFVNDADLVRKGDPLFAFHSPELDAERAQIVREIQVVQARLSRLVSDQRDLSLRGVLMGELNAAQSALSGVETKLSQMVARSPRDGKFVRANDAFAPGRWISPSDRFGLIRDVDALSVSAFVEAEFVHGFRTIDSGRFIPDAPELLSFDGSLIDVVPSADQAGALQLLLDIHGGPIPSVPDRSGGVAAIPAKPHYQLTFRVDHPTTARLQTEVTGVVRVLGESESLGGRMFRRIAGVLIRESGF